jgi:hypothetical protein
MLNKDASGNPQPLVMDEDVLPVRISGNEPMSFTSVGGVLIVASKEMDYPVYIEFNATETAVVRNDDTGIKETIAVDMFTSSPINIEVRDLWGVEDSLDVDERPVVLTPEHDYSTPLYSIPLFLF